jgi:hypothetical protein
LDEAGVNIIESDRDAAFLNVSFSGLREEGNEPGFIGRLFNRNDANAQVQERNFNVRLVEGDGVIIVIAEAAEATDDLGDLTAELLIVINDNLT